MELTTQTSRGKVAAAKILPRRTIHWNGLKRYTQRTTRRNRRSEYEAWRASCVKREKKCITSEIKCKNKMHEHEGKTDIQGLGE